MTDDLKLVERLRDPQFAYYRSNINSLMQQSADAIERLVRERDEARNSLIQARNERDEDRQRRRDLHARHAVEITALRADRDRLAKLVAEMREQIDMLKLSQSLDKDSAYVIRQTLAEAGVPVAAFVDDHVRNAIAQRDRLAALVAEMREGLADAAAHLAGAASAYRAHASRHRSVGRATSDPFFTTRVGDFDRAAERARALLTRTQEQVG